MLVLRRRYWVYASEVLKLESVEWHEHLLVILNLLLSGCRLGLWSAFLALGLGASHLHNFPLIGLNQGALCNICRRSSVVFQFLLMVLNFAWDIHVDVNFILALLERVSWNALVLLLLR